MGLERFARTKDGVTREVVLRYDEEHIHLEAIYRDVTTGEVHHWDRLHAEPVTKADTFPTTPLNRRTGLDAASESRARSPTSTTERIARLTAV